MSSMKELWEEQRHEAAIDEYIESEKQDLRKEGAEEMRIEILRALQEYVGRAWTPEIKHGLQTAIVIVEQANI